LTVAESVPQRHAVGRRLLGGPTAERGAESLADHETRLGVRPPGGRRLLEVLRDSGLRGRGGAWFPTWRKWAAVADKSDGHAVVVVNGSEGEPLSAKDRALLQLRPHVVLDGAALAAETLGADDIVIYLSRGSKETDAAIRRAIEERSDHAEPPIRVEHTAHRYIAGESSAVIDRLSGGQSKPRFTLQRSAEKGVNDQPTLVQNAETLAHVAMIARSGSSWFRRLGTDASPGSALMTLCGNVRHPGVYEVDLSATLGDVLREVGGSVSPPAGALLGGYFGSWLSPDALDRLPLDVDRLRSEHGAAMGCGVLAVLPQGGCAIVESTRILAYLAAESAEQCGPCINGLAALSETMQRIASSTADFGDIDRVWRWIDMVKGRGACHHPDGAVRQLFTALTVFKEHLRTHLRGQSCHGANVIGFPTPPAPGRGWK
jgi:NADH:ubiquinone oxidoreductase subunit F (NADH-binding)